MLKVHHPTAKGRSLNRSSQDLQNATRTTIYSFRETELIRKLTLIVSNCKDQAEHVCWCCVTNDC